MRSETHKCTSPPCMTGCNACAVTNCLAPPHQLAKVLGAQLWPMLLRGMSIQYTERPPPGVPGATYSHLCEDLASLQTRLLQLVALLSPSKLACAPTDSPELVDHIIRILHTAPVAASTNRDLLLHARSILLSGLKLPHEHHFSMHIRGRLLDLIDGGRLFARQRVDSHQVYARHLINDVVNLARASLSVQQVHSVLEVYMGDLLDDSLSLSAQGRSVDLVHKLLETQCAAIRAQGSARDVDPRCRALFSLSLRGLLRKLESLAYQVCTYGCTGGGRPGCTRGVLSACCTRRWCMHALRPVFAAHGAACSVACCCGQA